MIICPIVEGSATKAEGVVAVRLVNENMKELETTKGNILKGNTIQSLDAYEKAHFLLKIMDTSEGGKFRLVFNITYQLQGNPTIYEDVVVSQPFKVTSNKKIMSGTFFFGNFTFTFAEAAKATNLKPERGYCMFENEVWIKGRSFSENKSIKVKFGELSAKVCEVEDNLLTVVAPPRTNLTENTTVPVLVMATSLDGSSMSVCENLTYTYLINEIK